MTLFPATHRASQRRTAAAIAVAMVVALAFAVGGCGSDTSGVKSRASDATKPLRVGVSPVPHGEILRFVEKELAPQAGLKLDIVEYADYVLPNVDLVKGQLDANYFQTPAFLDEAADELKAPLVSVAGVHIEPLGVYSQQIDDPAKIPIGAKVALPTDDVTVTRALRLLAAHNVIDVKDEQAVAIPLTDVTRNPKRLVFDKVVAAQTPRALDDHDLAVINGNYALEAGLTPARDALFVEPADDNSAVNLLVTLAGERDDPRIKTLARLLRSPEVRTFIEDRYRGAVLPAF